MLISLTVAFSNDTANSNSTELELFLFKIGFTSMLNDLKEIKTKSNINTKDLENLTSKMEYFFSEIDQKKIISAENNNIIVDDKRYRDLEVIIVALQKKVELLEAKLNVQSQKVVKVNKFKITNENSNLLKNTAIQSKQEFLNIYEKPFENSNLINKLGKFPYVKLGYCDKYGWCKLKEEPGYVKKHILNFN